MIYVLQVKTGKEQQVQKELSKMYCHAMVPRQIITERKEGELNERESVLFPGYVFIDLILTLQTYYKFKAVTHVIKFLGGGQPAKLSGKEAAYIVWLNNGGKPLAPSEIDTDGNVINGPLKDREDSIVSINKRQRRAKLKVDIMGEVHEINLAIASEANNDIPDK